MASALRQGILAQGAGHFFNEIVIDFCIVSMVLPNCRHDYGFNLEVRPTMSADSASPKGEAG